MRRSSLRIKLLLVSGLSAVLVIGGLAFTGYVVVAETVEGFARENALNHASVVAGLVSVHVRDVVAGAEASGLEGDAFREEATRLLVRDAGLLLGPLGTDDVRIALYDERLELLWVSDTGAVAGSDVERRRASITGERSVSVAARREVLGGLFSAEQLSAHTVHSPFTLPGGGQGVVDVTYHPRAEAALVDAMRIPMVAITVAAAVLLVLMMQLGLTAFLRMIDELRQAADLIREGRLDVRLPVDGGHEVAALATTLNDLIAHMRQRSVIQTRFVADASHELATPVAGIRGYSNILRAWGASDPEVLSEAIASIDRESRKMTRLCGDLLTLVRSEQPSEGSQVRFDAVEVLREAMASAITRYKEKGVDHLGPPDTELIVFGDPQRFGDVMSGLVDNAFKYTPPGGSVSVDCWADGVMAVAEVRDTGVGIPEADLPNIFERFYRADAVRYKDVGGFGLGLSIAKTSVDSMKGSIDVHSVLGEGTTFTVRIPRNLDASSAGGVHLS